MTWWFYFLWILVLPFCNSDDMKTSSSRAKCPKFCICHNTTVTCGKRENGLKKIPKIPDTVEHFTFLNGNISTVNKTVLLPISKCPLHYLALLNDNITLLSSNTFEDFPKLRTLDLSGNNIPVELLKDAFVSLSKLVQDFKLSKMYITNIPKDLFKTQQAHIKSLNFSSNKFRLFDNDSFLEELPQLENLDLSFNHIMFFSGSNANLISLNLDGNLLGKVPDFCHSNGSSRFIRLAILDIENNEIQLINTSSFLCLTHIEIMNLGYNDISVIKNNTFSNLPSIKQLDLSHMSKLKEIEEFAFNSTSLSKLFLYNNLKLTNQTFPGNFPFKWAPNLSELDLHNTDLDMLSPSVLQEMFSQLKSVKSLNLVNTKLTTIPSNSLSQLHQLEILNLGLNNLATWDDNTFANLTHLKYINLNNNGIRLINETSFPVETRLSVKEMSLGGNDFLCTCALQWFRTWMEQVMTNKTIKFTKYPHNYYCKEPTRLRLDKFNPTYASCHRFTISKYVLVGVVAGTFLLLVIVMMVLIYHYRWKIRYLMYTRKRYTPIPGRDEAAIYDAFVVYAGEDNQWVITELSEFLENDRRFRLCIHNRDFEPGKLIVDNIWDSIRKSNKIILVLSQNFMRSQWCQFESNLALYAEKEVLVVNLEKVAKSLMSGNLLRLVNTADNISWRNDDAIRAEFRSHLERKMNRSTC